MTALASFTVSQWLSIWQTTQIRSHYREREKHYISSSHLGLIRCLTPFRVRISTIASI